LPQGIGSKTDQSQIKVRNGSVDLISGRLQIKPKSNVQKLRLGNNIPRSKPSTKMKIILTGATGFVGGEALKRAVAHPGISEVLVLTRRDLAAEQKANEKVKVILHADFAAYPDAVLEQLAGAEACIWCLRFPNPMTIAPGDLTQLQDGRREEHRLPGPGNRAAGPVRVQRGVRAGLRAERAADRAGEALPLRVLQRRHGGAGREAEIVVHGGHALAQGTPPLSPPPDLHVKRENG
jgi:hypothetical protein